MEALIQQRSEYMIELREEDAYRMISILRRRESIASNSSF